jgi:hypothetical protein
MTATKKKRILRKFKLSEISPVDRPAQGPAIALLMKRAEETGDDLAKITFMEALDQMKIKEGLHEAMEEMWKLNDALRLSVQSIVEDPDSYPDPVNAIRQSFADFSSVVQSMIDSAFMEEVAMEDDLNAEKQEKPTKTEVEKQFLSSDFALVPDPQKPSTWKLRLTSTPGGEPDSILVGAAVAALDPEFSMTKNLVPEDSRDGVIAKLSDAWEGDLPEVLKTQESPTMTKKAGTEPTIEDLQAEVAKRNSELEVAKAYGALNDAEKAHYNSLDADGQKAFIAKSEVERGEILKNLADENPVIFKSADGEEFRKNDDPRLVKMAKQADEDRKEAKREREERQNLQFAKRASDDLGHLPGEEATKIAVLKAVDSIKDEDVRKHAMEMLKASDAGISKAMTRAGSSAGGDNNASEKLDTLAKRHQEDHEGFTFEQSYDEVLKTDEGQRLYNETLA